VPAGGIEPGDVVRVSGRVERLERFDEIQRRRGALAAVRVYRLAHTGVRRGGLAGALDAVRRRAEAGLDAGLPRQEAALLAGMTIGREDRIDTETRKAFQASGLAHLLAVSGTNVMLLATLVLALGGLAGVPLRGRLLGALVLVALYVPLTGAGPSIQRAGVMGAAGLVAALAGRPASRWYALGLAAAGTLALNPYALAEAGWQLSFAAVVGLLWLATPLRAALDRARVPAPLAEAGAMTVAATIATAPLLALHFEQVSLVSLPANLVVAPVVAPLMWLGMLAAALGQVAPALAVPVNVLNAPLLGFVDGVAATAARVPHAVLDVHAPGVLGAAATYAAMAAAWLVWRHRHRWVRAIRGPSARGHRSWRRPAAALAAAVAAVVVAAGVPGRGVAAPVPGETVLTFLDVGQGDATLVQRDGAAVLFDTGPPEGRIVARLEEAGVSRLDALVLTHGQADHEGAAVPVVERFRPRLVIDGGAGWPTPVQRALPQALAQTGGRATRVAAGDLLRLGALELRVLWPPPALADAPPEGDPNQRALVVHVRSGGFDALLTADAESDVTGSLDLPDVDVLKVAHHGSEDPGLPAELEDLRPEVAGIEVGRHNTYGHPAPSTLAALAGVPELVRTDLDGSVRVRARGGRLMIERLGGS
jgi:competence protein ComEC